jgi:hypothetical protein
VLWVPIFMVFLWALKSQNLFILLWKQLLILMIFLQATSELSKWLLVKRLELWKSSVSRLKIRKKIICHKRLTGRIFIGIHSPVRLNRGQKWFTIHWPSFNIVFKRDRQLWMVKEVLSILWKTHRTDCEQKRREI